jgi:septal ring factor EnvC (AmiA/AmiB activator)
MTQELAQSKVQLESSLTEQREEMADLAIENERQGADFEKRINNEVALRAELATLQGRIVQRIRTVECQARDSFRARRVPVRSKKMTRSGTEGAIFGPNVIGF